MYGPHILGTQFAFSSHPYHYSGKICVSKCVILFTYLMLCLLDPQFMFQSQRHTWLTAVGARGSSWEYYKGDLLYELAHITFIKTIFRTFCVKIIIVFSCTYISFSKSLKLLAIHLS